MAGASNNIPLFRRSIWILAGSALLLVIYYVEYRPVAIYPDHQPQYPATLPTIVGFQREPAEAVGKCKPSRPTGLPDQGWQSLGTEWHLYSAHLDNRTDTPLIRIIALLKGPVTRMPFCLTWPDKVLSPVRMTELWVRAWDAAAPGQYHHPYLLSCPVASAACEAVSVVYDDTCDEPSNLLNVTSVPRSQEGPQSSFAVCLKPVDFGRDIAIRVLEWVELQFLLGADRVMVYAHRLHPGTRGVLEHYGERVHVVDHSPPPDDATGEEKTTNWTSLWQRRRLEVALYNDCFYRHVQSHDFVVNLDLDEAIVPLVHDTWADLLEGPAFRHSASISARNVYFFDSLGFDPSIPPSLHMLRHVYRSANFTPPGFAQKSFFSTRCAEAVAHHYALRALLRPGGGARLMSGLDPGLARLHHYRSGCPDLMQRQCERDFMRYKVRDTAIWRFKEALAATVARRVQELKLDVQPVTETFTGISIVDT